MNASLTPNESRVLLRKLDSDPTKPFCAEDRQACASAQQKLTAAMLSCTDAYHNFLVDQGMAPGRAAQRASQRASQRES